jgi:hypothetical protein
LQGRLVKRKSPACERTTIGPAIEPLSLDRQEALVVKRAAHDVATAIFGDHESVTRNWEYAVKLGAEIQIK